MFLSEISIKRPVFITMVTVCLMTLGMLGARKIGVDLFPDVSFPFVSVVTVYKGAGPTEVERQVTERIEEAVSAINGVVEVRSYSRDSVSTVVVQFKLETDVKVAASEVRERVFEILHKLPKDIEQPLIQRVDPAALPILVYAVSSGRDPAETRYFVEDRIKPNIESVDGVAGVKVVGGREREVRVRIDRLACESLGLGLDSVADLIASSGIDVPAGKVFLKQQELLLKTSGRFKSVEQLANLPIGFTKRGEQVLLKQIATVESSYKDIETITRLNGQEAVTFEVQKQGGGNTVAIADHVYEMVTKLKNDLPKDYVITKAVDSSTFIRRNIYDVTEALVLGGLMAILVIFLFMLDWRSTLISSLALPTSVVTTFFFMWWLGFTFNMMSLLGLSLAIGLLIDDAVVVRENIYRHMEAGEDPFTAARKGTSEIALAVLATTLSIVAVFVPVAFMGGVVGKMFKEFGLTVTAAVMVSLFISFTLDPMMSARVVKPVEPGAHEKLKAHRIFGPIVRFFDRLSLMYRALLVVSLRRKKTVVFSSIALFVGSLCLVPYMGKEFFSTGDKGEFRVNLELPAGTSLQETDRVVKNVEDILHLNSGVRDLFTVVGVSGESYKASIRVYTTKSHERKNISQEQIQEDIRYKLQTIPSLRFNVSEIGMLEGADQELPIMLNIRGDDYERLQQISEQVLQIVKKTKGATDVDISFRGGKPELAILPNRAKAADRMVNVGQAARVARIAFEGEIVGKIDEDGHEVDIRVQLATKDRSKKATVSDLTVQNYKRELVKISDFATIVEQIAPSTIERMERQRQIVISANVYGRSLGEVVADIEKELEVIDKPANFIFEFGGQTQRMREAFENMGLALIVAIIFIYFVLASQFESFIHPFTIMVTLPLAIVGAFVTLFLSNYPIGMPALIGIVLLMGLVTKNAILLVDYTNTLRTQGLSMNNALLEAGPIRLRPILMTSAAMVLGMIPTAFGGGEAESFRAPMAIAVIGGVIASTFLTLIVVPVVYTYMDRFTRKGERESFAKENS